MASVSLTGVSAEDAASVFDVLRAALPADRPAADVPWEQPGDHSAVWSAEFEPTQEWSRPDPVSLKGPVSATLQGDYVAVDQLLEALSAVFTVHQPGSASGDQEQEVDLQLGNKA